MVTHLSRLVFGTLAAFALIAAAEERPAHNPAELCIEGTGSARLDVRICSQAIALEFDSVTRATLLTSRAYAYVQSRESDLAVQDLELAIELYPHSARAFYLQGQIRRQNGDGTGALKSLDQALALFPHYSAAHSARGIVYFFRADLENALESFQTARALSATNGEAVIFSGLIHFALGNFKAASARFEEAEALGQAYAELPLWRHLAARRAGHPAPAPKRLSQAWPVPLWWSLAQGEGDFSLGKLTPEERNRVRFYLALNAVDRGSRAFADRELELYLASAPSQAVERVVAMMELQRLRGEPGETRDAQVTR